MILLRYCLAACFLLCCQLLAARQKELFFEHYTSRNGLSQNSGYSVTQDRSGFIWMGTQEGLNRFDGYEFISYRKPFAGSHSTSNQVDALLTSSSGPLWAGTPDGLFLFNIQSGQFETFSRYFQQPASAPDSIGILKLFEDPRHKTWILTRHNGLFIADSNGRCRQHFIEEGRNNRLTDIASDGIQQVWVCDINNLYSYNTITQSFKQISIPTATTEGMKFRSICWFNKELWIGTAEHGVFIYNPITGITRAFNPPSHDGTLHAVTCMLADKQQQLWIGTRNEGLYRYNPATAHLTRCRYQDDQPGSLRKDFVLSLFEDRQGIIWIGLSGGGFAKYDLYNSIFHTIRKNYRNNSQLNDNMLFSLFSSGNGELFIGAQNGGLVKWNTINQSFTSYKDPSPAGVTHNTVYGIASGNNNQLWLATWGGLCLLDLNATPGNAFRSFSTGRDIGKTYLYSVFKPTGGNNMLVSGANGLYQFDTEKKEWIDWVDRDSFLLSNRPAIRCFLEDNNHMIWMGTEGLGLLLLDRNNNRITPIQLPQLNTKNIRSLHQDNNGQLWIGSDNGLVQFDPVNRKLIRIWQTADGLPNNVIYGILSDQQQRLWLSTNNGLSCFDLRRQRFFNYDISYGLQGTEFNTNCCYRDPKGVMYFGGIEGLTWFHPGSVPEDKFNPAPVITGFHVMNNPLQSDSSLQYRQHIRLQPNQNFFSIDFSSLNFSHTNRTVYAYKLSGIDEDWVFCGHRRSAGYTKLPPGNYTFQVKAANNQGNWNSTITSLRITILPEFWQTKWFLATVLTLAVALTWWLIRRRIRQIRHEARLQQKISTTEMMALRAQMNPHFIFNCINSIDALIQSNDKYNATVYLNKFARLIRNILDSSNQPAIPLSKDLDTLRLYIELEQLRNENKFTVSIQVPDDILQDDLKVPPLIIQPYVENAILHGLRNRPGNDGKLVISISRNNDYLLYRIEDNGVGRAAAKTGIRKENISYGMAMTRDRVKLFNKENDASVQITDLEQHHQPAGTRIEVQLKIQ
ncbi:MAG: ligand-binding sensor domain-containing protein [Pseudobacter sp.]|uniref:ligand-binding sensor domain-containing protein n=1 Tax=Pseudobacter sp. TaxID=2045420 RepID=UPI003F7F95CE